MALDLLCGADIPAARLLSLFGDDHPLASPVGLPDHWCGPAGEYAVEAWQVDEAEDIRSVARTAYAAVVARLQQRGFPALLRTWTYFDRINEGEGDAERYRQFCIGRAEGLGNSERFPAATVIGSRRPGLWLWVLAGRRAGLPVENPRQVPAWQYPRIYGPQSPGFARALWLPAAQRLLVSGTSSVVGHLTAHPFDAPAQLAETHRNLQALVAEAQSRFDVALAPISLRLYVRDTVGAEALLERCRREYPGTPWGLHIGDVCRADLTVEIEGVFGPG